MPLMLMKKIDELKQQLQAAEQQNAQLELRLKNCIGPLEHQAMVREIQQLRADLAQREAEGAGMRQALEKLHEEILHEAGLIETIYADHDAGCAALTAVDHLYDAVKESEKALSKVKGK